MAFPQGVNFRATSGYVTDGTNQDYNIVTGGNNNYPYTSAQGNSYGWETGSSGYDSRNRSTGIDVRLAGCNISLASASDWRIDLPSSGDYSIRLAVGDYAASIPSMKIELFDTSSSLGVLCNGSTSAADRFLDASGTEFTSTAWVATNSGTGGGAIVTNTFSTSILRLRCGNGTNEARPAHFYIEAAASAAGQPTMRRFGGVPGMTPGPQSFGRGW